MEHQAGQHPPEALRKPGVVIGAFANGIRNRRGFEDRGKEMAGTPAR